jgi:hypothetical protein
MQGLLVVLLVLGAATAARAHDRPSPADIATFVADRILPAPGDHFEDFRVTRPGLEHILERYHQVDETLWRREYSHVAFADRTGHVVLADGRTIGWLVKPGGLAWLQFPDGRRMYLAAERTTRAFTPERLTGTEWRLFSDVFPMLPGGGYAIRFYPQGTVDTDQLARVGGWALNGTGDLELREKDGETLWTFRWYPEQQVLVSCPRAATSAVPPLALAPAPATADAVGGRLRALGLQRCQPGTTTR